MLNYYSVDGEPNISSPASYTLSEALIYPSWRSARQSGLWKHAENFVRLLKSWCIPKNVYAVIEWWRKSCDYSRGRCSSRCPIRPHSFEAFYSMWFSIAEAKEVGPKSAFQLVSTYIQRMERRSTNHQSIMLVLSWCPFTRCSEMATQPEFSPSSSLDWLVVHRYVHWSGLLILKR